jgi:tRNA(Ile)-lysidine synthase
MLTLVRRAVKRHGMFAAGELVLCGCSGGADSTAMLHALALLRAKHGHRLAAVGIDHGLRTAAASELGVAERLAVSLDVPFERVPLRVRAGANLQARARDARHRALQRAAARLGCQRLALAHTADDRAETVLLRLLRGAGPRGLAAMGPSAPGLHGQVPIVRPLLLARRRDVLTHLERHGLEHAEDPSNRDRRFLRVRVREELLPLLEELSPGVVETLCTLADSLAEVASHDDPLAGYGRRQREQLARALRERRATTVRVSGARELQLTFRRKSPVLKRNS